MGSRQRLIFEWVCDLCGHNWQPTPKKIRRGMQPFRDSGVPQMCPRCTSWKWNRGKPKPDKVTA
jgi:rubredoxin